MAGTLVALAELKNYAGVVGNHDNGLLNKLITRAEKSFEAYTTVPICSTVFTEYHSPDGSAKIFFQRFPINATLVVTDTKDDTVVSAAEYKVDSQTGIIVKVTSGGIISNRRGRHSAYGLYGSGWGHGERRYKVVANAGHDQSDSWGFDESEVEGSLFDIIMYWYENRDPATTITKESLGLQKETGVQRGIPRRIRDVWEQYRPIQVG